MSEIFYSILSLLLNVVIVMHGAYITYCCGVKIIFKLNLIDRICGIMLSPTKMYFDSFSFS